MNAASFRLASRVAANVLPMQANYIFLLFARQKKNAATAGTVADVLSPEARVNASIQL